MTDSVQANSFRLLMDSVLEEFIEASRAVGEPLYTVAMMVKNAFQEELNFIIVGVTAPRPADGAFSNLLLPLSEAIREIQTFRDRNRAAEQYFNHLSTISESIVALSWISVTPAPAQFVRDMRDAGQYFGNRVLSSHKGNAAHANWINKWNEVLKALEQYVRSHHLTGFSWGTAESVRPSRPFAMGSRMPPPPPSPCFGIDVMAGGDDRLALFNQINQGDNIVRMLRPVRRDDRAAPAQVAEPAPAQVACPVPAQVACPVPAQVACPVPAQVACPIPAQAAGPVQAAAPARAPAPVPAAPARAPAPVPAAPARAPAPVPAAASARSVAPEPQPGPSHARVAAPPTRTYPPKFVLDGRKWRVEHQRDNLGMTIDNDDMSQSLAMFKCQNAGLHVQNKMNAVTIDNCKFTTVVVNDVIASVDAIRCDRLKIQCLGRVPLILLDNCDSVQIFVTKKSRDVEVISSKSTSCNICLLDSDGDYTELPVPEQIRTRIGGDDTLESSVVEKV